ncbi:MAG TPA: DUF4430 domain-containing protein [Solirubrobacteraceae bacterium]|jgi:hypothetical protein|nr:DUF4430 domain-containing protein [Solirubrobacteraceae bacterium]
MRIAGVLALLAALAGAGCGVGAGEAPEAVRLTVTDGFGTRTLIEQPAPDVSGEDTVMRVLQRNAKVKTRYGGLFVEAIGRLSGGSEDGRPVDWFYYVNGVLADEGAAAVTVRPGDRIWWDRRDWSVAAAVPAVVGSFPEPFAHGVDGDRMPTRIECSQSVRDACDVVQDRFKKLGIVAGKALKGTSEAGGKVLRVAVGTWDDVRGDPALRQIDRGPRVSGVYGRFDGDELVVLDQRGREVRRLGPGTGLVAATRLDFGPPVWAVTGTDAAGVRAAARALDESVLNEKFALAISDALPVALPAVRGAR